MPSESSATDFVVVESNLLGEQWYHRATIGSIVPSKCIPGHWMHGLHVPQGPRGRSLARRFVIVGAITAVGVRMEVSMGAMRVGRPVIGVHDGGRRGRRHGRQADCGGEGSCGRSETHWSG